MQKAEEYLIQVLQKNSTCKHYNELCSFRYHYSTNNSVCDLPPTTNAIRLHIKCAFYVTHLQLNCLNEYGEKLNVLLFGFIEGDDLFVPQKVLILLPTMNDFVPNCQFKACLKTQVVVFE